MSISHCIAFVLALLALLAGIDGALTAAACFALAAMLLTAFCGLFRALDDDEEEEEE